MRSVDELKTDLRELSKDVNEKTSNLSGEIHKTEKRILLAIGAAFLAFLALAGYLKDWFGILKG
jgi:hypothetical protein